MDTIPLKIAIDCRAIGKKRTGDEVYVKHLVFQLAKNDHRNNYFLLFDRKNVSEKDIGFSLPPHFKIVTILPAHKLLWTMYSVPRWLRKHHVDVLHVQYITPFWLPRNIKVITTIHDVSWKFYPEYIKKSDLFFLNTLIPLSLARASRIITVSETSRRDIIKIYNIAERKVVSIYNGVGEEFVKPSQEKKEAVMKKYNLPEKFILYVGTLQPRKNVPALLEAFQCLVSKWEIPGLKLVIVGGKGHNYDSRIDGVVKRYHLTDKVLFPGYIDSQDLPSVYASARLFVFPSLYEGFGIPLIEAMGVGTPVVASNQSCLPEVVGEGGMVVDPHNTEMLAQAMRMLLTDELKRKEFIEKGYKRAAEFTWEKTAKKTLELYYA